LVRKSEIISVSITKEQVEFLALHNFSPSELLQDKIIEQKKIFENFQTSKNQFLMNIRALQNEIEKHSEFLDNKGLWDEFCLWRNKNVVE